MKTEVLLKLLCHNVVVVHQSIIELVVEPTCWPKERTDEPAVIRFPAA